MTNRFFYAATILPVAFASSFSFPSLWGSAIGLMVIFILLIILDAILLFREKNIFECKRQLNKLLSLGSENKVKIILKNTSSTPYDVELIDELPYQLQERSFSYQCHIEGNETIEFNYMIVPKVRGAYNFGKVHCYAGSRFGLMQRKISHELTAEVAVYPSIIEMNKYELMSLTRISTVAGIKKIRRLGHSYEFDQIKNYVKGDDYQSINWKATGRMNDLMVNHYEDEKSQQVYLLIDKSRAMKMPFNGLSLLDYAINTSLVISNTAINKQDKVGLISFSNEIETTLKADKQRGQLKRILENLYREKEGNLDANYELMYRMARNFIKGRSLIFLFTNFENLHSLHRNLNVIRKLAKLHLLVVVIFENTEIEEYSKVDAIDMEEIYYQTIAQKFISEKHQIKKELTQYGIQTILSKPEELSINSINKYLELKARGMI